MTDRADITAVLDQMRMMRAQIQRPPVVGNEISPEKVNRVGSMEKTPGFGEMFSKAIDSVNEVQKSAGEMRTAYEKGEPGIDITRVMVESQKATVSFQALTQVRNKVVKAYEEIMKMPV
ncbi:MAG: flagellar hook-basal body complex protein FliE [Gammaproteobacteria bacterium]|nr:MAG: flagellar hook-basal body complex protein FliE [Pseudomonadota bacterium]PIE38115.1 MAG: flagellar hook-basal body complex protein FliE [Gammaproteobacteria bacterium]